MPSDEWNAISLNYTSGTTGNPKGVVYHHRGAALMCYANTIATGMGQHPVYLWTLPMFHCNGWCFPWSISLRLRHACLPPLGPRQADVRRDRRSQGDASLRRALRHVGAAQRGRRRSGAPSTSASPSTTPQRPPPAAVLAKMDEAGFELTHLYGLTETYGPATLNEWHAAWDELPAEERLAKRIRQGVRYHALEDLTVMDPETMEKVAADGETLGEVMFRGNIVMKGYLKNEKATEDAFAGGWFHSGDLGVLHPDGYIQLKDRSKDIIISGGENISSIEVEDVLYKHPAVAAAAVVAKPDAKWGETPCAFVELRPGATATEAADHRLVPREARPLQMPDATSCSSSCPRPRPARSRNSSCATWRTKSEPMPLLRFDLIEGRREAEIKTHRAMLAAFAMPERDRYRHRAYARK